MHNTKTVPRRLCCGVRQRKRTLTLQGRVVTGLMCRKCHTLTGYFIGRVGNVKRVTGSYRW